jgi:hypothetical protein
VRIQGRRLKETALISETSSGLRLSLEKLRAMKYFVLPRREDFGEERNGRKRGSLGGGFVWVAWRKEGFFFPLLFFLEGIQLGFRFLLI